MEDRLVQYPNRVRLIQVDGQPGVYDIEAVPGTVTANGTPLNKATLLSDTVATLVNNAATPNEALKYLAERVQPITLGGTGATTVGGILANLGIADYIVEQGTTNAWSWEKYANGKIHCARKVSTGYTATESSGNLYYQDYDVVVPNAVPVLTNTINNVIIMPQAGNGLSFFMVKGISGKTISYRYVNSASVTNNQLTVLYQFDGKWK